jgi:CBS domain-containing protein
MRDPLKPLLALTAGDLMTTDVLRLTEEMPLREAGRLILNSQVGGAPVVDARGKCVGVLSGTDFLRLAFTQARLAGDISSPLPLTCSFQAKGKGAGGAEVTLCTLPPGVCPIQVKKAGPEGKEVVVCGQPHCVLVDWQMVEMEKLPSDPVRQYMTADPVTVVPSTPIRTLARLMIDAHIHRVIVVDEEGKPQGIVSATDVLAALAYAEGDREAPPVALSGGEGMPKQRQ